VSGRGGSAEARQTQAHEQVLSLLAAETGAALGDLGVRPEDERWIRLHAETLESLFRVDARRLRGAGRFGFGWLGRFYRLARRAARTER
jgi:hypothetical protein